MEYLAKGMTTIEEVAKLIEDVTEAQMSMLTDKASEPLSEG